jgi:hypothetical protein
VRLPCTQVHERPALAPRQSVNVQPSQGRGATRPPEIRSPLRFEAFPKTSFGLTRECKTTKQGVPKNPLQLAVLVRESRDMFYFAGVPLSVQRAFLTLFAPLASVGKLLGYKACYPSGCLQKPRFYAEAFYTNQYTNPA